MTGAMLSFEGLAKMVGRAEATENYFKFCTNGTLSNTQLNELHRATIEIDGRTEGVLVESTDLVDLTSEQRGAQHGLRLTLRRMSAPSVLSKKTRQ